VAWLFNEFSLAQAVSQRTATAVMQTNQYAAMIANRPTETSGPTPTIDINSAATLQYVLTQTFAPFAVQTEMQVNMIHTATQSSLQTIIALTPTNTPTITRTPSLTPPPTPTRTPTPVKTYVTLDFPSGCSPNPVPAGIIVFGYGVGSGESNPEAAKQRLGANTYGTITLNGKTMPPASVAPYGGLKLDEHGRTTELQCNGGPGQCGYITFAETQLGAGSYEVRATWPRADGVSDPRGCTLIVK